MTIEFRVYGVRGSAPISGKPFNKYGGNTSSYTIRTPSNSLIFLDAGTGLRVADQELDNIADKVYLVISHTHADHIQGLGMTRLPYLSSVNGYENQLLNIIGPSGVTDGLTKYYDGEFIWPVKFSQKENEKPRMYGIDYTSITVYSVDFQTVRIDETTEVSMMKGNHPVHGGVVLYRFRIQKPDENPVIIVYATDNEFDFINIDKPNPKVDEFTQKYKRFIADADLLIADAQYTKEDYHEKFRGFGHAYHQQIIDIAENSGVGLLLLTHHHFYTDEILDNLKSVIDLHLGDHHSSIEVRLAREADKMEL